MVSYDYSYISVPTDGPSAVSSLRVETCIVDDVDGDAAKRACFVEAEKWSCIAAGIAMKRAITTSKGMCDIDKNSVYGAAVAFPQYARTAGWSLDYTGLVIRVYVFLLANVFVQGFFIFMISKELRINDKYGGQMHLCDYAANIEECPGSPNCIGPGGTAYTPPRLYSFEMWITRTFVRDSLRLMFPDRSAEVDAYADPGEYGLESYELRCGCHFIFVLGLWSDLAGSYSLFNLLYHVPTAAEPWMALRPGASMDQTDADAASKVSFMVAGMPLHWKLINLLFVLLPKAYLWLLLIDNGTLFLMETATIDEMILNAIALVFILNIDELIFENLLSDTIKKFLEELEPLPVAESEPDSLHTVCENHSAAKRWNMFSPRLYAFVVPFRLLCIIGVTIFFQFKYYAEHCDRQEDGSFVSKELHYPMRDRMPFTSFFFGPFPALFPVDSLNGTVWTMPAV